MLNLIKKKLKLENVESVLILSSVGFWSLCNSYLSKNSFKLGQKGELRNISKAIDQKTFF